MLIASLDREIAIASIGQRNILLRDKVMIIAGRCLSLRIPQLLAFSIDDVIQFDAASFSFWNRVDTNDSAIAMLHWYIQQVRPQLVSGSTNSLFTTQDGSPLRPTAFGMRFARAVHVAQLGCAVPDWTRWARIKPGSKPRNELNK